MDDRIRLAEAMGWTKIGLLNDRLVGYARPEDDVISNVPDPFTDANDDYAVLEWMRAKDGFLRNDRLLYDLGKEKLSYQIGDYARAALRVIDG